MGVGLNLDSEYVRRSSIPSGGAGTLSDGAFANTFQGEWVYRPSATATYALTAGGSIIDCAAGAREVVLGFNSAGSVLADLNLQIIFDSGGGAGTPFTFTGHTGASFLDEWVYYFIFENSTDGQTAGYVRLADLASPVYQTRANSNAGSQYVNTLTFGNEAAASAVVLGYYAYARARYATGITIANVLAWAAMSTPDAGDWAFWPLADNTDTGDDSGNGRTLTFGGTLSSEASPTLGGGGVTVNLTGLSVSASMGSVGNSHTNAVSGQSATVSRGAVVAALAKALSGQSATVSRGAVVAALAKALSGQSATVSRGSLFASHSNSIIGQSVAVAAGTVAAAVSKALSGLSVTASPGSVVAAIAAALAGQSVTISQGALGAGSDVTVALTGQAATAAVGSVGNTHAKTLTGQFVTASRGTVVASHSNALTGQSITVSRGVLAYSAALALVGAALSASAGNITTGNDVTVSLTGQAMAAALGTLSPVHANALAGASISVARGSLSASHASALTGQSVGLSAGTIATARALALLGIPCTVSQGTLTAQQGTNVTVSLTGLSMASETGTLANEVTIPITGMVLALLAGDVYALTPAPETGGVPYPSVEGSVASPNPVFGVDNPEPGTLVAGENGCIVARFARMDSQGHVWNGRRSAGEILGFVLTVPTIWGRVYWSNGMAVLRAGQPIMLMSGGDFWCRFESGAIPGAQVYASLVDGAAVSGYAAEAEATPWYVVTSAAPGELSVISTTSRVQ